MSNEQEIPTHVGTFSGCPIVTDPTKLIYRNVDGELMEVAYADLKNVERMEKPRTCMATDAFIKAISVPYVPTVGIDSETQSRMLGRNITAICDRAAPDVAS